MRLLPLAVLFACCWLLGGCSSQESPSPNESVEASRPNPPEDSAAPAELAMVDEVLRLVLEQPDSYRPTEIALTDQSAVIVADLLYDGLTEAVGVAGQLRPGLAEAWWPNDDYTVWTFSLDPDADVAAETVVASLLPYASSGKVAGSLAGAAARLAGGIRLVYAPDRSTVIVELDGPNAGLPWVLSGLPFSVVGPDGQPTGSYRVGSDDAAGLRLTPRPGTVDDPRPIRIDWNSDRSEAFQRLQDGEVDGALVPPDQVDGVTRMGDSVLPASVSTRFYVLHLGSQLLADPEARVAVRSALDRDELAASNSAHLVVATDGLLPPSMTGYRPDACGGCDLVDAGQEVSPNALGNIEPLEVAYTEYDQETTAAEIVAQLEAAGMPARAQRMEPEQLAAVIVGGGTDIFSFGWVAAATSSDAILPVLLTGDSPANVARIGSEDIDRILAAAAVTADDQARWDLHHQAHQAALSSGRLIPIAASRTALLLADDLENVTVRADGSLDVQGGG